MGEVYGKPERCKTEIHMWPVVFRCKHKQGHAGRHEVSMKEREEGERIKILDAYQWARCTECGTEVVGMHGNAQCLRCGLRLEAEELEGEREKLATQMAELLDEALKRLSGADLKWFLWWTSKEALHMLGVESGNVTVNGVKKEDV